MDKVLFDSGYRREHEVFFRMAKAKKKPAVKKADDADSEAGKTRLTAMTPEDLERLAAKLRDYADKIDAQAVKMRKHNMPTADILGIGLMDRAYKNVNLYLGRVVAKVEQTDTPSGVK